MHDACTCQGKGFRHIGKKSSDTPSWCDLVLGSSHDLVCVEFLLHYSHDKHEVIASSCKTVAFLRDRRHQVAPANSAEDTLILLDCSKPPSIIFAEDKRATTPERVDQQDEIQAGRGSYVSYLNLTS